MWERSGSALHESSHTRLARGRPGDRALGLATERAGLARRGRLGELQLAGRVPRPARAHQRLRFRRFVRGEGFALRRRDLGVAEVRLQVAVVQEDDGAEYGDEGADAH